MQYLKKAIPLLIAVAVAIWLISEESSWGFGSVLALVIGLIWFIPMMAGPLIGYVQEQEPYRKSKAMREKDHITISTTKEGLRKQLKQGYIIRNEYIVALVNMDMPADELFELYEQDYITRDEYMDIASGFIELRDWNEDETWPSKKNDQKKKRKWDLKWRKVKIGDCLSFYEENQATREEYLFAVKQFKSDWLQDDRKYFLENYNT